MKFFFTSSLMLCLLQALCIAAQARNTAHAQQTAAPSPKAAEQEVLLLYTKALALWDGDICTDPALAVALLNHALREHPGHVPSLLRRGLAYSELAQHDKAFADMSQAIRLEPTALHYAYRALAFMREENFPGARKDLERSIKLDPSQHKAWSFRGALNLLEERLEDACADFSKSCKNGDCAGLNSARNQGLCQQNKPKS